MENYIQVRAGLTRDCTSIIGSELITLSSVKPVHLPGGFGKLFPQTFRPDDFHLLAEAQ